MKKPLKHYSQYCHGATLLEVLVGLALIGSLAVAMVIARSNLVAQEALAQHKIAATAMADRLMNTWWDNPAMLPRHDEGQERYGKTALRWRTRTIEHEPHPVLAYDLVRLEILHGDSEEPVLVLEVVCPTQPLHLPGERDA